MTWPFRRRTQRPAAHAHQVEPSNSYSCQDPPGSLSANALNELEQIEHTTLSMVVQALTDYASDAQMIFREETDLPQDIAEDITREAIASMGLPGIRERLYGKVDVKKAIYVFLPEPHPVALMLDAKAEKSNGNRTATIQMSQRSMTVMTKRAGRDVREPGKLEQEIHRGGRRFYVVTIIAKYIYRENKDSRSLDKIIVACIPNGLLQERYNPSPEETIWLAGRDAPTLGEDFRVRLSFRHLKAKAEWRVQEIALSI